jgi:dipeptidyl-peptidase 4
MKKILLLVFPIFLINAHAQDKQLDLKMAVSGYDAENKALLYPSGLSTLRWVPNTHSYSHLSDRSKLLLVVQDKVTDTVSVEELAKATGLELKHIPFQEWKNEHTFIFRHRAAYYEYDIRSKNATKLLSYKEGAENQDYNSITNLCAITVKQNLCVASTADKMGVVTQLPNKEIVAGQAIARFEFGISKGTFWSTNGKKLAFYQKDESRVHDYPLLDMTKTPGTLNSIKYPMAGQESELARVGIFEISSGKLFYLKTEASGLDKEHYLTNLAWGPNDSYVYIAEVNRDQNQMMLNKYDANSGEFVATLFEEKNDKYVEPEHPPAFIPGRPDEFLWFSERDGFMNLYHYNTSGKLLSKVTKVKWVVKKIIGFNNDGKEVIVEGTGEDPRENHAFIFNIKTGNMRKLTQSPGTHRLQLSSDGKKLMDSYSSITIPRNVDIVDVKTTKAKRIFSADNPLIDYKHGMTEFLKLASVDGSDLYGRIIKPANFNKKKKYPVLVYVYGGPHAQLVTNSWMAGSSMWMSWMAEQGYLVFTLDGRGSANRGFEFESGIHRQLGKLEMEDQMIGVDYLKSLSYVDPNRMAVHGWSFGGFMTTSLMLKKPGTFKCGVAGGPVIDWKWYEVMYGERYMDRPEQNKEGYGETSLLDKVGGLEGDLLMIHGTVDDVVVMQHNLAFVKACVDEGVQVDFFPYPNHKHNVRGKDRIHLMTKVLNYVIEKLAE